jgi:NTF2 fold immunity protein
MVLKCDIGVNIMVKNENGYYLNILILVIICSCSFLLQCSDDDEKVENDGNKIEENQKSTIMVEDSTNIDYLNEVDMIVDDYHRRVEKSYIGWDGFPPEQGLVPDKITAVKIAEAIWLPLYGEMIYDQRPYRVRLVDDSIWIVHGQYATEVARVGLIVHAKIRKSDGKVLLVLQEK